MSEFTYEFENKNTTLEVYEWDNVWWEHTESEEADRVLYIGDSISCATRKYANSLAGGTLLFDGFGTSKAVDNPYFSESLKIFAAQQKKRSVVLFNNGLHGWHLSDGEEYAEHYEKLLSFIEREFEGARIIILLTTHVSDPDRDMRVRARNKVVLEIAAQHGLDTVDLYRITAENADLISADGVHLRPEGYELLAKAIIDKIGDAK